MAVILLAEDHPLLRCALEELLTLEGHRVVACCTLSDCRDALAQGCLPDLLVSDAILPDGNGRQLIAAVRHAHLRQVPAVFLSAWDLTQVELPPGTQALRKPCDLGQLLAAIRSCVPSDAEGPR